MTPPFRAPASAPARLGWNEVVGPLLTLLVLGVLQPFATTPGQVPVLMVLYCVPMVFSAYVGGLGPGLASVVLGAFFALIYLSEPGRPFHYGSEGARNLAILLVSMPTIAITVGRLQRRVRGQAEALSRAQADRRSRESAAVLAASEARYRVLMEEASDGIFVFHPEGRGRVLEMNRRACEISGYRREELLGQDVYFLAEPEERDDVTRRLEEMRAGSQVLYDRRWRRKDGSVITVEISAKRLPDGTLLSIFRDVTERRRVQGELDRALALHRATPESTVEGILVVSDEGRWVSWNRRLVELWRLPEEILASRDDDRALQFALDQLQNPRGFLAKVRELHDRPEAESFDVLEFRDGRLFERYSRPHRVEGRAVGRVWSFRDVTDRHLAQEALRVSELQRRQAYKLEAIGRLAGGVAHDFNNLLTVILAQAKRLRDRLPADPRMQQSALEVLWAAERAASLTRQLRAFSRRQVLEPRVIQLNDVVRGLQPMLARLIGEHIRFRLVLSDSLAAVRADPGQLEQVLLNLVLNAGDAMPSGGALIVETAAVRVEPACAPLHHPLTAGRWVRLAVSDTGIGMDAETRERIFEPFFSTKDRGEGVGLGLATVYGVVQQSGGHILVYSEPRQGSTFKIFLPALDQAPEPLESAGGAAPAAGGDETVLVVEDEESVRRLVCSTLEPGGYRVLVAANGPDALEVARRHPGPIHLMVTDVVMPRMSGVELRRELRCRRPETRVLFMSGYTDEAIASQGVLRPGVAFIEKPFDLEALARRVREVLDAPVPDPEPAG